MNLGAAQQRLDQIADVQVDVMALALDTTAPHLELLCYNSCASRAPAQLHHNDIAATRVILTGGDATSESILDPDGHYLVIDQLVID